MPGFIADDALDAALNLIRGATHLVLCKAMPASFSDANTLSTGPSTGGAQLGVKASPVISVVSDRTPTGRKFTVNAITDGTITADGVVTHYALINTSTSKLLAAQTIASSQNVSNGNSFALTQTEIGFPDAA